MYNQFILDGDMELLDEEANDSFFAQNVQPKPRVSIVEFDIGIVENATVENIANKENQLRESNRQQLLTFDEGKEADSIKDNLQQCKTEMMENLMDIENEKRTILEVAHHEVQAIDNQKNEELNNINQEISDQFQVCKLCQKFLTVILSFCVY